MSAQVICNPAELTGAQRQAVAEFILNFPGACAGSCGSGHTGSVAVAEVHDTTATVALVPPVNELDALQHDHESTMPEAAFGTPAGTSLEAVAAFGAPTPLTNGNTCAPSPAGVAPQSPAITAQPPVNHGLASLAAPAMPGGVELDKHGLPWDNRIHAESKAKIADGSWRKKRGVDAGLVAQVEAELRQVMGAPAVPLAPTVAPSVPTPPPAVAAPVTASLPTASASPVAVPPPPAPVAAPADPRQMFVALVGRASAAIQAGKVSQDEINQACQAAGVPALPLLANRLDLVATVAASVDAIIASRG